jgi:hypothetical protein
MTKRCKMPKMHGLVLLSMLAAGCTAQPADPIAAEKAELDAQIAAMKHHPSVLERAKLRAGNERSAAKKSVRS